MIFDFLRDLFFPRACVACRAPVSSGAVCEACVSTITVRPAFVVPVHAVLRDGFCEGAADYRNKALQALVHSLKFEGVRDAAVPLAEVLVRYAAPFAAQLRAERYCLVPIPLSRRRERARGFNQAALISHHFGRALGLPVEANVLVRTRHTKPQSETSDLAERTANLHGCFELSTAAAARAAVRGGNILLIDDVTTSGTTFAEAMRPLKAGGAANVIALACAKVPPPSDLHLPVIQ